MAELITEDCPRIKFSTRYKRQHVTQDIDGQLRHLAQLMHRMEDLGAAPILNDSLVGGNCAVSPQLLGARGPGATGHQGNAASTHSAPSAPSDATGCSTSDSGLALVSRSGKAPGYVLQPHDFVLVVGFDRGSWAAEYASPAEDVRPSSDSPLLVAALAHARDYGWSEQPLVVLHGHALAEGEGLAYAAQAGLPISAHETLFSTPEDLRELEGLFVSHPYPQHRCYIRRGHGFFLLARSVGEAEQLFSELVEPWLLRARGGS